MHIPFFSSLLVSPLDSLQVLLTNSLFALFTPITSFLSASVIQSQHSNTAEGLYLLGLGIADITGPVVETNMMGYASTAQTDTGLHMRQRVRAFLVADPSSDSGDHRILLLNADIAMGDTGVRRALLRSLNETYKGLYHAGNVAFVGTHQHSGVGGFMENLLPQITSLGLHPQSFAAILNGSLLAVHRAHASLAPGYLSLGNTTLDSVASGSRKSSFMPRSAATLAGSRNRSPTAYLANPASERARYVDAGGNKGDMDWGMSVLRFGKMLSDASAVQSSELAYGEADGDGRGFLSFFAVHGTSIYENNTLISGDNKGMAAYMYESSVEPYAMPGNQTYVAGFVQGAVGDTSPNTLGAFCESPGEDYDGHPCTANSSTCGGRAQQCHGRGPGFASDAEYGYTSGYGFASNGIIGGLQAAGVQRVLHARNGGLKGNGLTRVKGSVRSVHAYVDMSKYEFALGNGTRVTTCPAAMGFSFAGGTTDGPGAFDFVQGDNRTEQNPFWEVVKRFVTPAPPPEQIACQYPKPILLNTGYAHKPYEWSPSTVDVQILKVGNFVILVIPGELTTMAGRRIREAVRAKLISSKIIGEEAYVVVAGPANTYAHYITTREEYGVQRYEGASTLYGPFTLEAYVDKYTSLIPFLADIPSGTPPSDPPPEEQISKAISLGTSVKFDAAPLGKHFGQIVKDVSTTVPYRAGDTVAVRFIGANPRNNLRLEGTFLSVDQLVFNKWQSVRSDSHPSTIYRWTRESTVLGTSVVDISWTIEQGTSAGTFRISYFGDSKPLIGAISPFMGTSSNFTVL
ncbi:Neutral/alkaline nonlysosomal ceramidase [Mycena rebaudengoi]|nr:Neutral/alkaline nonlysosomal ceramidase [Mycena rebaudengoi]